MQQLLASRREPPIGFAHRGAKAHAPENTLDAFRLAVRLGATGIESDVWLTADGIPVLDHDGVVRVGRKKRAIADLPRAELPAHIPTLSELYDAVGTDLEISLDLKDIHASDATIAASRLANPKAVDHLWLCHSDWRQLVTIRERHGDVHLIDSTRLKALREGPERRAAELAHHGIDGINLHHSDWSGGLVTLFHRFERYAFAWDLQFPRALVNRLRMGIDAVYSDHVDRMVDALGSYTRASITGAD
ncbi:MAG: glycerophosphodiester phosphodiesterase [Acidimicrobiia bacterium]